MLQALLIIGALYIVALVGLSIRARKTTDSGSKGYFFAGGSLGGFLGLFTFAATLFSTFTILGMPNFFRNNGVGSWVFLALGDAAMFFGIIWIGRLMRKRAREMKIFSMAKMMKQIYGSALAGYLILGGVFIFLIPYVSIQIHGVMMFLDGAFPDVVPPWVWAVGMVVIMLLYSEFGGLKAIIYNDTLQGFLLLIAIWIVAVNCIGKLGGWESMFSQVAETKPALLSTPGPNGMFSVQWLLASMIPIMLLPYTQPQVSTRLMILKDNKALNRTALGLGIFAILVILPTMFLGMYGAILYPDAPTSEFLTKALITDQSAYVGAFIIIGLIAAAISTSDSQIFALGSELLSLMEGDEKKLTNITKIGIVVFALLALGLALKSNEDLVLLARTSFAGTALLAPMIFLGLFGDIKKSLLIPGLTVVAVLVFLLSSLGAIGGTFLGLRVDLFLMLVLSLAATGEYLMKKA